MLIALICRPDPYGSISHFLRKTLAVLDSQTSRSPIGFEWLPVTAGLFILFVPTFYTLAINYWGQDDYAHGPIILAVIGWLIWDKRHLLLTAPTGIAKAPGFVLLIFGLLLYVLGRSQRVFIIEIAALAPILAGVLLVMRGWSGLRAFWFMLLFIAYLVPLPGMFLKVMTGPLKLYVSKIAEQILYTAGYPVANSGVILTIGQYQLLVADACAGLNSMISLSALGLLYLYLIGHKNWLHNGLILASLVPIAFMANIVRVLVLVLVTYYFGDAAGQGFAHGFSGLVLFVIALAGILALDAILAVFFKSRNRLAAQ